MPPKPKFTKAEITLAALNIASEKGIEKLTAQELAKELNSSARPIFTVFSSIKEVQDEVIKAAMTKFESYVQKPIPNTPLFKQIGMQMVSFAMNEPKLYRLLFMKENNPSETFDTLFEKLGIVAQNSIKTIKHEHNLSDKDAKKLFENVWIFTFGIGALCATGMCKFSNEELSNMLSEEFSAMMMLIHSSQTNEL